MTDIILKEAEYSSDKNLKIELFSTIDVTNVFNELEDLPISIDIDDTDYDNYVTFAVNEYSGLLDWSLNYETDLLMLDGVCFDFSHLISSFSASDSDSYKIKKFKEIIGSVYGNYLHKNDLKSRVCQNTYKVYLSISTFVHNKRKIFLALFNKIKRAITNIEWKVYIHLYSNTSHNNNYHKILIRSTFSKTSPPRIHLIY